MKELKKEDINQEVFNLYDEYAHNKIDRRQFAEKLSLYAIGGLTVTSLMSFMMPDYVQNLQIQNDDPRLDSGYIEYDSPKGGGTIKGLLSQPAGNKTKLLFLGIILNHSKL